MTFKVKDLRQIIGKRLQELRQARGWTQATVAAQAGITRDFLGMAERGERDPSLFVLSKLAAVFEVDPVFLLTPPGESRSQALEELDALLAATPDSEIRWYTGLIKYLMAHPVADGDPVHVPSKPSAIRGRSSRGGQSRKR